MLTLPRQSEHLFILYGEPMKVSNLIDIIEKTAPLELAATWDKSGVQVAAFRPEVQHVAVMLDPILPNIAKAQKMGADFILAHHPLSMEPLYPDALGNYHSILSILFKADIHLYSAHTSLDANLFGPVSWLAKALQLQGVNLLEVAGQTKRLTEQEEPVDYGFGFVGELPEPLGYQAFAKKLSHHTQKNAWRSCGPRPDTIRRVACCPGSGGSMTALAHAAQADIFITGDMRYHAALDTEVHVIDLGHFQLEEIMMKKFAELLASQLTGMKIDFIPGLDPFSFDLQ